MMKRMQWSAALFLLALLTALAGCAGEEAAPPLDQPPKTAEKEPASQPPPAEEEAGRPREMGRMPAGEEGAKAPAMAGEEKPAGTGEKIPPGEEKGESMVAGARAIPGEEDVVFGPLVPPVEEELPPQPAPEGIPFDEAVPPLPKEPVVRVAVYGLESHPRKGDQAALIIGASSRAFLEEKLGAAVKIAFVSRLKKLPTRQSAIRFRPNFLLAAQSVAAELPREQTIAPMNDAELRQEGVDLIVYIGEDFG